MSATKPPASRPTVGFIGVGNMGWPMAACLVKAGFSTLINDSRREVANNFVQQHGGTAPDTLQQLAAGSDVVVTMLPTSVIGEHVFTGGGDHQFPGRTPWRMESAMIFGVTPGTQPLGD